MRRPLVLLALCTALVAGCGGDRVPGAASGPVATPTPHFAQAGTEPPAATSESPPRPVGRYLVADVDRTTWLRARPGGRRLERVRPRTEFGSDTVLGVVGRRGGWLKVVSALLPNHRHGWIPERRATLAATDLDIVVDRSAREARLRRDGRVIRRFSVAVGRPGNETPLGRFAVTDKLRPTDETSPYGCCAVALSGHQTKLEPGWPGGDRLAIHGTPQPETIGRAVSLGCMRAGERDLRVLLRRVPLGTPVFVRA